MIPINQFQKWIMVCLFFSLSDLLLSKQIIKISSQEEFDKLSSLLKYNIENGANDIIVSLKKGNYYFSENHITISNINNPNLSISINANGSTFIGKGGVGFSIADIDSSELWKRGYIDKNGNNCDFWSEMVQLTDTIQVIDKKNHICRLKSPIPIPDALEEYARNRYISITRWYLCPVFQLIRSHDNWIYFKVTDTELEYRNNYKCLRINDDYGYGKVYPRFKLFIPDKNVESLYISNSSRCVNIANSTISGFVIDNIIFNSNSANTDLIRFENVHANNVIINHCTFRNIHSPVVIVNGTDNFRFSKNMVKDCYYGIVSVSNNSRHACITDNTFSNFGMQMSNCFGVTCKGSDFIISNNTFTDFSYGAIGVGIHHMSVHPNLVTGIVEKNVISYTDSYRSVPAHHNLMDAGAIYCWTINDRVIIRNNYIHDYSGIKDYRGIFCDDGTKGVSIYGNIIYKVPQSYCIYLRYENTPEKKVPDYNTNNHIGGNILNGPYLYQGRKDFPNKNSLSENFLLVKEDTIRYFNVKSNIREISDDTYHIFYDKDGLARIHVPSKEYRAFKKIPGWKHVKKYVIKSKSSSI